MGQKQGRAKDPGLLLLLAWCSSLSCEDSAKPAPSGSVSRPGSRHVPQCVALLSSMRDLILPQGSALRGASLCHCAVPQVACQDLRHLALSLTVYVIALVTHPFVLISSCLWLWQVLVPMRAGLPTKTAVEACGGSWAYFALSHSPRR